MKPRNLFSRSNLQTFLEMSDDVVEMLNKDCVQNPDHCPAPAYKILMTFRASTVVHLLHGCFLLLAGCFCLNLLQLLVQLFALR